MRGSGEMTPEEMREALQEIRGMAEANLAADEHICPRDLLAILDGRE